MASILNPVGDQVPVGVDFPLLLEADISGTWTVSINGAMPPSTFASGTATAVYTTPPSVSNTGTFGAGVDTLFIQVTSGYTIASKTFLLVQGITKINCTDLADALTSAVSSPGPMPQYQFQPGGVSDIVYPIGASIMDEGNAEDPPEGPVGYQECLPQRDCGCGPTKATGGCGHKRPLSIGAVGGGGAGIRQPEPMYGNITEIARASVLGATPDGKLQTRSGCGTLMSRGETIDLGVYYTNIPDGPVSAERVAGLKRSFGWQLRLIQDSAGNVAIYWGDRRVEAWPSPDSGVTFQSARGAFGTLTKQGGRFTRTTKAGVYYDFDTNGRLQTIKDRSTDGNVVYYNYNGSSQMIRMTGPGLGYRPYFTYDASGRVNLMNLEVAGSPTQNRSYYYRYDATGRMNALVGPSLCVTYFDYDGSNNLSSETNADNYKTTLNYDSSFALPKLKNVVLPEQAEVYFSYNNATYPTTQRAQVGGTIRYFYYQWAGLPHKFTSAGEGQKNYFLYDAEAKPTLVQATNPTLTYYTWDSTGQVQSAQGCDGFTEYYTYTALGRVTSAKDALGRTTYWNYSSRGYQTNWIDTLGKTTYFERNSFGQMTSKKDRRGNLTYYTYDSRGNHTSTKWADLSVRYYDYDFSGSTIKMIDENACVTYYDRDARCRITKWKDAVGGVRQVGYDGRSNRTVEIDARGNASYWQYDGLSRLIYSKSALGEVTYYNLDKTNTLSAQVDPLGNKGNFSYTGEKQLQISQNPLAQPAYYTYTATGLLQSSQDAKGCTEYYTYDCHYRKTSKKDALGNVTYWQYDAVSNVIKVTDPRNNASQTFYDALNRQTATQNALSQFNYFYYDQESNQTTSEDALQRRTYFYFDSRNRSFCTEDAQRNRTYLTYDGRGLTTSSKDPRGNVTYSYYDCLQRNFATRDARNNVTYLQYDPNSNQILSKSARGFTTYYAYDAVNRKTSVQTPLNEFTYYTYDRGGNQLSVKDARGNLAYTYYDTLSRAFCQEDAKKARTYFTFDSVGNQDSTKDPLGRVSYTYYDCAHRKFATQDALAGFQYFTFDRASNQDSMEDERGNVTYSYYDALNRSFATLNAVGALSYIEYDKVGNRASTKDPLSRLNYFYYDTLNRLTASEDALQKRTYYTYDASANQLSIKNARRVPSEVGIQYFTYDALNRKSSQKDELGSTWYFDFDASSNVFVQKNPVSALTYWTYDADERKQSQKDPLNRTWYWTYDAVGNLSTYKDGKAQTTSYTYDTVNLNTRIDYPDGQKHYYEYDQARQRTAMADPTGRTIFVYDNLSRMTFRGNPGSQNLYYEYDAAGNRTALRNPDSIQDGYVYDAVNRMTGGGYGYGLQAYGTTPYGGQGSNYEYDLANQMTHERRTNGAVTYYGYDQAGRMSLIEHRKSDGSPIERWDYTRDEVGNILNQLRGSDSMSMYWNYDQGNRISKEAWRTAAGANVYGFLYTYDKSWNRNLKQQTVGSATNTYWDYDAADQVKRQKNNTTTTVYYTYDNCGNLSVEHDVDASAGRSYYDYDPRNLVTRIDFPGATATNYFTYNAMAERVRKDDSTGGKKYTWDGNDVILEKNLANTTTQRIVKGTSPFGGVGNIILQDLSGTLIYPHKNQVGTTQRTTDSTGAVKSYYEYDAWGQPLNVQEAAGTSQQYRYTGKELDPDFLDFNSVSRRYHFPARFYLPFRGNFAQIDPLAMMSAGNKRALYLYALANPLLFVDPDGRESWQQIRGHVLDGQGNVVAGVGGGGGAPNWGGMNSSGMWSSLYNPANTFDTSQQVSSSISLEWTCPSGAVYNYVDMGGGMIQNPCQVISGNPGRGCSHSIIGGVIGSPKPKCDGTLSCGKGSGVVGVETIHLKGKCPADCDATYVVPERTKLLAKGKLILNANDMCECETGVSDCRCASANFIDDKQCFEDWYGLRSNPEWKCDIDVVYWYGQGYCRPGS